MISPILGRGAAPSATVVNYFGIAFNYTNAGQATESSVSQAMPTSGTLRNLFLLANGAPGTGTNIAFEVMKNGVATGLVVTIADTATSGSDTTHSVSYVQGDIISLRSTPTATPSVALISWSLENSATSQVLITSTSTAVTSNAAASYASLEDGNTQTANTDMASTFPTAGTVSLATILASVAPGAAKSWTATFVKNGVDTALVATLTGTPGLTSTDNTNSVAVVAGDTGYWRINPVSTPASARVKISYAFTPTIDGESVHFYDTTTALSSATAINYSMVGGGALANTTSSSTRSNYYGTTWDFKKLYASVDTAPGASASWAVALRLNAAIQTLATTITDPATSANDTTHTSTPATPGQISVTFTGSGTPALTPNHWSFVTYRAPIYTKTQTAIARMANTITKTQPSLARIATNRTLTQPAIAQIAKTVTKTQTATANIQQSISSTKTQSAIARIALNRSATQPTVARIANTRTKTQPSISRIANTKTKTQPAIARVASTITKIQTAIARIVKNVTKVQTAIARISQTNTKTQPSTARISKTSTRLQTAIASIKNQATKTQPAIARISKYRSITQTATASIQQVNPSVQNTPTVLYTNDTTVALWSNDQAMPPADDSTELTASPASDSTVSLSSKDQTVIL